METVGTFARRKFKRVVRGDVPPNPVALLSSDRFKTLLEEVKGEYDCVILDTPRWES